MLLFVAVITWMKYIQDDRPIQDRIYTFFLYERFFFLVNAYAFIWMLVYLYSKVLMRLGERYRSRLEWLEQEILSDLALGVRVFLCFGFYVVTFFLLQYHVDNASLQKEKQVALDHFQSDPKFYLLALLLIDGWTDPSGNCSRLPFEFIGEAIFRRVGEVRG